MSAKVEKNGKRAYRKRLRAEREEETRQRITEAAVDLHGSIGPARTTVSAVAERAGVQRATVYRHFPDEAALFGACSAHWIEQNPPPDFSAWAEIEDPVERLRQGLGELYAWYGGTEGMLERTRRDAPLVPAMAAPMEAMGAAFAFAAETLTAGRRERGARKRRVEVAVAHAIDFQTWASLVRDGGLGDAEAVELMLGTVAAAAS